MWKISHQSKVLFLWLLPLFLPLGVAMAQSPSKSHTISGYVTDGKSQETLIGASVYEASTMKGTVTNNFGYYTLKLGEGQVKMKASFVGFAPYEAVFNLKNDTIINIALSQSNQLDEVTVTARAMENNVKGAQMSTIGRCQPYSAKLTSSRHCNCCPVCKAALKVRRECMCAVAALTKT